MNFSHFSILYVLQMAHQKTDGSWEALNWNAAGRHTIDVVPGPSLTYEILADPASNDWWQFWGAHNDRFADLAAPWSRAEICGARIAGPGGEDVFVTETRYPTLVALGSNGGARILQHRAGIGVSLELLSSAPTFLVVSSGQRRKQGKVLWLGPESASSSAAPVNSIWADAVRNAAARHWPLEGGDAAASRMWIQAVQTARRFKRSRR